MGLAPPAGSSFLSEFPSKPEAGFEPADQILAFYARDGKRLIGVPMSVVDNFNDESISMAVNYGALVGACIVTLAALVVLTPLAKLRRPTAMMQMVALVICLVRGAFEISDFISPVIHFYVYWAGDYSGVPRGYIYKTLVGHFITMLANIAIEIILMNQAWTMVSLFPRTARMLLVVVSAIMALVAAGLRVTLTVSLVRADIVSASRASIKWIEQGALISSTVTIFWFCALFNAKLVLHLIANRGLLPSARKLSSMEILVMTNGLLMVIPVIFAGLEYGSFRNFEPALVTTTSVAVILPLGTLAAQRTNTPISGAGFDRPPNFSGSGSSAVKRIRAGLYHFRKQSVSSSSASPNSKCERSQAGLHAGTARVEDPYDLELRRIDSAGYPGIRIDQKLEQRYENV
ncbi:hypothetical protein XA68_17643 [Ophiocordyceps unilateralis]|uniref:Pheromone receptor n=1 Tax=Ophiocordyceps unilateralis TaxID=268505 RepID=A0A2A9P368_OPHUN|nr:hypothetical protein XA68_17643 [Ophiocordyceps unilateralis]